jgi:hypothetical protein
MDHLERSLSVEELSAHLSDSDARVRHEARELLVGKGEPAIHVLRQKLSDPDWHVRWEAVKALGEMSGNPPSGPEAQSEERAMMDSLVNMLNDDDTSVRWAAMESLIQLGRTCVRPLLESLTRDFGSARMREGAYHVLHTLLTRGMLTGIEFEVCSALKGPAPAIQTAWAANKALIKGR